MTDINKTQTSSYLQKMSLLRRPSHFIMNQNNQQVEKENMYKISNIGFVCFLNLSRQDLEVIISRRRIDISGDNEEKGKRSC